MYDPYYGDNRTRIGRKTIILIAAAAVTALILCVIFAVKGFGKKKPAKQEPEKVSVTAAVTEEEGITVTPGPGKTQIVRKYSLYGNDRNLKEQEERDEQGFLLRRITYYAGKESAVFEYLNNAAGLPVWGTYRSGNTTGKINIIYDAQNRVTSREWINYPLQEGFLSSGRQQIIYDQAGNITLDETKSHDTNLWSGKVVNTHTKTVRQFDENGRITLFREQSFGDDGIEELEGREITYSYYDNGNRKTSVDRKSDSPYEYDDKRIESYYREDGEKYLELTFQAGKLAYQTEYEGNREVTLMYRDGEQPYVLGDKSVKETYDAEGRLIYREVISGNYDGTSDEYVYSSDGKLLKETHRVFDLTYYGSDEQQDREINVAEYEYDGPNGECTKETHDRFIYIYYDEEPMTTQVKYAEYKYDVSGNMIRKYIYSPIASVMVEVGEWEYDAKNRMIHETVSVNDKQDHEYEWEYIDE